MALTCLWYLQLFTHNFMVIMPQSPNEDSTKECTISVSGTPLSIHKCAMVVQMPSVEQMRQEVADITCQMQSVYIDPQLRQNLEQLNCESSQPTLNEALSENKSATLHNAMDSRWLEIQQERVKSNTLGNTLDHLDNECSLYACDVTSTNDTRYPREEQVAEEFVINGKRYRQVYQRRVVLERKTTRDIFFLPANNAEAEIKSPTHRSFEYRSPNYDNQLSNSLGTETPLLTHSKIDTYIDRRQEDNYPQLNFKVAQSPTSLKNEDKCSTPMVVMRPLMNTVKNEQQESFDCSPIDGVGSSSSEPAISSHFKSANNKSSVSPIHETIKLDGSRTKRTMKTITETIKRTIKIGLRRTKSNVKTMEKSTRKPTIVEQVEQIDVKPDDPERDSFKEQCDTGLKAIQGYMYKFGVWDERQPVLDPRLPLALTSKNQSDLSGTIVPTAPEWHHAEMGPDVTELQHGPFVRGRTVACLQRFTQHSAESGKALHRSTYVQQTRIVRQLNREDPKIGVGNAVVIEQEPVPMSGYLDDKTIDSPHLKNNININIETPLERVPELQVVDTEFMKCSNDRLQLLQSLCPAAAAATILLGKPISTRSTSNSIEDLYGEGRFNTNGTLDELRLMVSANSWCPKSLLVKDLSPYLILNKNTNVNKIGSTSSPTKSPVPTNGMLELTIRGGTLDTILLYALEILQLPPTDHPDSLFPHVLSVIYPTFTSPEVIIEKLIQIYIAHSPIEPGCQSKNWIDALTAAEYLITIVCQLHPEQFSASLILRLARFVRLLELDGKLESKRLRQTEKYGENHNRLEISAEPSTMENLHKIFAERLMEKLPVLSSNSKFLGTSNSEPISYHRSDNAVPCSLQKVGKNIGIDTNVNTKLPGANGHVKMPLHKLNVNEPDANTFVEYIDVIKRVKDFLATDASLIAKELTQLEEEKFAQIDFRELLDIPSLEHGEARTLGLCVEHFNQLTKWARNLLIVLSSMLAAYELSLSSPSEKADRRLTRSGSKRSTSHARNRTATLQPNRDIPRKLSNPNEYLVKQPSTCQSYFFSPSADNKDLCLKRVCAINRTFVQFCEILKHLKQLNNFSSFLALLLAVQEVPECILTKKSKTLLATFSAYMRPPNFAEYRRDLEASSLPCLPYLGLIFQQLIHLHAGNPLFLPEPVDIPATTDQKQMNEPTTDPATPLEVMTSTVTPIERNSEKIINVWRCWKHYLILGYFIKRDQNSETSQYKFKPNTQIREILNNFNDYFEDTVLNDLKEDLIQQLSKKHSFRFK